MSSLFNQYHPVQSHRLLAISYLIGTLSSTLTKSVSKDFSDKDLFRNTADKMLSFYMKLDGTLEEEFSSLID